MRGSDALVTHARDWWVLTPAARPAAQAAVVVLGVALHVVPAPRPRRSWAWSAPLAWCSGVGVALILDRLRGSRRPVWPDSVVGPLRGSATRRAVAVLVNAILEEATYRAMLPRLLVGRPAAVPARLAAVTCTVAFVVGHRHLDHRQQVELAAVSTVLGAVERWLPGRWYASAVAHCAYNLTVLDHHRRGR